jgi:hypothetical protein
MPAELASASSLLEIAIAAPPCALCSARRIALGHDKAVCLRRQRNLRRTVAAIRIQIWGLKRVGAVWAAVASSWQTAAAVVNPAAGAI